MSITDELRKWGRATLADTSLLVRMEAIADRIDAEHDKALNNVDDAYDSGYNVGYDEGFASADDWLAQHEDAMAEHGWIRLPKDADGVPIHVGDVMEERSGHTFEVASLMAFGGSGNWLVLSDPRNFSSFREPHDIRHHHAPTVEDVLREFAYGLGVPVADSYVAATAAKLRLAEGEDA